MRTADINAAQITLIVNGTPVRVAGGASVAAALLQAGVPARISIAGDARAPLCGMGICMECRAAVDGMQHVRTCKVVVRDGMRVETE